MHGGKSWKHFRVRVENAVVDQVNVRQKEDTNE